MTEDTSRHSQSGTAMCESSQHALLPAFPSSDTCSVISENVFSQGCVQNSCQNVETEIHGNPV